MSGKSKCPFCNKEMISTGSFLYCENDGFVVYPTGRAYFSDDLAKHIKVPEHLKESVKFIEEFFRCKPFYVLSPSPLWDLSFKMSECVFIIPNHKHDADGAINVTPETVYFNKNVSGRLIAANKILADDLVKYVACAIDKGIDTDPLAFGDEELTCECHLFRKFVLHNGFDIYKNIKALNAAQLFFQPTLEDMTLRLLRDDFKGINLTSGVTDEMALCSYLLTEPNVNIKWGASADELMRNCRNYIKACTNDLNDVEIKEFNPSCLQAVGDVHLAMDLLRTYLQSMPSTAVNMPKANDEILQTNVFPTFCILNHEYMENPFRGANLEKVSKGRNALILYNIFKCHAFLFNKYWGSSKVNCSMDMKSSWLRTECGISTVNPNETVITFWKEVNKRLKEQD